MPTPEEDAIRRRRQAYWLRTVRSLDVRKPTLADAAVAAGLSTGSGSVVSLWENDLTREGPKLSQVRRLAAFYGVPLTLFIEPPETDEERLDRVIRLASAQEAADWAAGEGAPREAEDEPADEPGRRSA